MPEGHEIYVTARVLGTFGYFDPEYTSVRIFISQKFSLHLLMFEECSLLFYQILCFQPLLYVKHVKI